MTDEKLIRALREKASRDNRELLDAAADRIEELRKKNCFAVAALFGIKKSTLQDIVASKTAKNQ